jgi:flagellar hook-basal body complex protein FliE
MELGGVQFRLLNDDMGEQLTTSNEKGTKSFIETLKKELEELNQTVKTAETKTLEIAGGKSEDILGAVVAMTEAELAVKSAVQIRNKVMQTYQTLIHMQV